MCVRFVQLSGGEPASTVGGLEVPLRGDYVRRTHYRRLGQTPLQNFLVGIYATGTGIVFFITFMYSTVNELWLP